MVRQLPPAIPFKILEGKLEIQSPPASKFKPLSRETKSLDGLNPQLGIVDEAAAIENRNVIEVITSALGSRKSQWMFYITTAQPITSTLYYERRATAIAMLKGELESPQLFAALYELDEGDDPMIDESCWIKANPNLGVSVYPENLRKQVADANATPSMKSNVLCKNFNVWAKAATAWIPRVIWDKCIGEVQRDGPCFVGTDLAQTMNLTVVSRLWAPSRNVRCIDFRCFMPQGAMRAIPADLAVLYERAIKSGVLEITSGAITDYDHVGAYLRKTYDAFDVESIGCDPWNATQLLTSLQNDGLPVLIVRQSRASLAAPSKDLETLIIGRRLRHDGNPFIAWQFENAQATRDDQHNLRLSRDVNHPERQTDAVTAAVIACAGLAGAQEVEGDEDAFETVPAGGEADEDSVIDFGYGIAVGRL